MSIGPAGGTVSVPGGASVDIPAGALASATTITITPDPSLAAPTGVVWVGTPVTMGPEGQTFASAVTITLPFSSSLIPQGHQASEIAIYTAPVGSTTYVSLGGSVNSTDVSATTTHFSNFGPGIPLTVCTPSTLSGAPTAVDTGVFCDGGGEVPNAGSAFPYASNAPSYEFQPCSATSDCGCAGAGLGLVCVNDFNLQDWGGQFEQFNGYKGACERTCTVSTDCDRLDTTCVGGFCAINICSQGFRGESNGPCDAQGCGDGTCIPENFEGYVAYYCQTAMAGSGTCGSSQSVTQPIPCDPGSNCTAAGCEQLCDPEAGSDAGCAVGSGCFSIPDDQNGTFGTCSVCGGAAGAACCLASGDACNSTADCCSGLACPSSNQVCTTCLANGSACTSSSACCGGSSCFQYDGGVCQTCIAFNAACTDSSQCCSDYCNRNSGMCD